MGNWGVRRSYQEIKNKGQIEGSVGQSTIRSRDERELETPAIRLLKEVTAKRRGFARYSFPGERTFNQADEESAAQCRLKERGECQST